MLREYTLFIDSRHAIGSSNVDFIVPLGSIDSFPASDYKGVKTVELLSIAFHEDYVNQNTFGEAGYFILSIKELINRLDSNNPFVNSEFAIIYMEDGKTYIKGTDYDIKCKTFNPPLTSLSRLSISLIDPTTGKVVTDDLGYVLLTFKISTVI